MHKTVIKNFMSWKITIWSNANIMKEISRAVDRRSTLFHVRLGNTSTLFRSRALPRGSTAQLCGARVPLFFFARGLCAFPTLSSSCPTPLSLSLYTASPLGSSASQQQRGNWPSERARVAPPLAQYQVVASQSGNPPLHWVLVPPWR